MKVFCIGLHKTATVSLHLTFQRMGFHSFHRPVWSFKYTSLLTEYDAFSDGGAHFWIPKEEEDEEYWGSNHNVSMLIKHFPDGRFVLNTRPLDAWLRSKMIWQGWRADTKIEQDKPGYVNSDAWPDPYFSISALEQFVLNRLKYHDKVISFFGERQLQDQLLILDYINDPEAIRKLADFVGREEKGNLSKIASNQSKGKITSEDNDRILKIIQRVFDKLQLSEEQQKQIGGRRYCLG
jgi:hypothetical protein